MVLRPLKRLVQFCRGILLVSLVVTGAACVTVDETSALCALERSPNVPIGLPEAEHTIDELDRVMTAFGTISIKTPDVWGQDRLAKFRSEYEAQMAGWLKQGFKSDINASVRHTESDATRVMVGANVVEPLPGTASSNATSSTATNPSAPTVAGTGSLQSMLRSQAVLNPGPALSSGRARQDAHWPRTDGRARRAFQLSQSPEPTAPHQCGRRLDGPARLWALPDSNTGDSLTGPEKPPRQGGDRHGVGEVGHDQAYAAQRPAQRGGQ